jgi:hypothetical protein
VLAGGAAVAPGDGVVQVGWPRAEAHDATRSNPITASISSVSDRRWGSAVAWSNSRASHPDGAQRESGGSPRSCSTGIFSGAAAPSIRLSNTCPVV